MKRNEHTFQFTGQAIADAAKQEHDYHAKRVEWWKNEQEEAVKRAREAGVEVREVDVTGGKRVDVVLDPTVSIRLQECVNKITAHQRAADRFQIEDAAYRTQAVRTFDLHPDDVVYFRLAGGPRDE